MAKAAARYVNPMPKGARVETYDQGIDWQGRPGQAVVALGRSQVIRISTDAGGFGIAIYLKLLDGPWAGRVWYVGHADPAVRKGQTVQAGEPVAILLQHPHGNAGGIPGHTEIGWASSDGSGPKYSGMGHGMSMPGGSAFANDLKAAGIYEPGTGQTITHDLFANDAGQPASGSAPVPAAAQLTPQQRSELSARQASAAAPASVGADSIYEPDSVVNDTPQLWAQIAGQDNISAETAQMAAQYLNVQQNPLPTLNTPQPIPAASGLAL